MSAFNHRKYQPSHKLSLPDRQWPNKEITSAPDWCSVDLRDGNQALIEPMSVEEKLRLWELLVNVGFTEIEIGFPSASQPDFDFARRLIEENRIPSHVTIQVLVQAREELIARTFEALKGVNRAIVHVYNSTSPVQRERVFRQDKAGIKQIALQGARWVREQAAQYPQTAWSFQYSPESFSSTETDYAVEICDAVIAEWIPAQNPMIINLPATVEVSTPNVFADQIEWFCRHSQYRSHYRLSVHTHNDRGCGVAAAELAVLAGADRVEGTLLGNGERTGNMDIVTMAMNLYSQGIDPELDLSNMDEVIETVTACTDLPVHPRHPYAGDLVYTAFSGSHQDAIRKCLAVQKSDEPWQVAYLPIDPKDIGRTYEDVIRVNSQSGKGGIAFLLEKDHHLKLPRWLQVDASRVIQKVAEQSGSELSSQAIGALFQKTYLSNNDVRIDSYRLEQKERDQLSLQAQFQQKPLLLEGIGDGALSALAEAWSKHCGEKVTILDYSEHAIAEGTEAMAVAYLLLSIRNQRCIGVAMNKDILMASFQAFLNAASQLSAQSQAA